MHHPHGIHRPSSQASRLRFNLAATTKGKSQCMLPTAIAGKRSSTRRPQYLHRYLFVHPTQQRRQQQPRRRKQKLLQPHGLNPREQRRRSSSSAAGRTTDPTRYSTCSRLPTMCLSITTRGTASNLIWPTRRFTIQFIATWRPENIWRASQARIAAHSPSS